MNNLQPFDSMPHAVQNITNARFAALMGDLSLVLNSEGVVKEAKFNDSDLANLVADSWINQPLTSLVSDESQKNVNSLLRKMANPDDSDSEEVFWEDISIPLPEDKTLPLRLGLLVQPGQDTHLAVGRDLRAMAGLRQQLLNAQLTVEQDYWRLRMVETRYRSLFQMVDDGLVVIDDDTGRVLESNAAANKLLAGDGNKLVGKKFPAGFDDRTAQKVAEFIDQVRVSGRGDLPEVFVEGQADSVVISASMLRQAEEARILLRISSDGGAANGVVGNGHRSTPALDALFLEASDAVVITDTDGLVISTNQAFVALAELRSVDQAIGRSVGSWIGKSSVEANVLITNLKRHRAVKLFATQIRGEFDSLSDVEISANQSTIGGTEHFLLLIRDVSRRISEDSEEVAKLPSSVAQITDQVGRVPLKDLVKQSTSVIEKLCIESALRITDNNRASAAELLGLSRQSLYAKLRQYELGNLSK